MSKVRLCAVVGCKNQWKPQKGVTYHSSPTDLHLIEAWREALCRPATPFSVCSWHFTRRDFRPGTRNLKPDAVPSLKLSGKDEASTDEEPEKEEEMPCPITHMTLCPDAPDPIQMELVKKEGGINLDACRICLATACRLYPLQKLSVASTYELLAGPLPPGGWPAALCASCALQLHAAAALKEMCARAAAKLREMAELNMLTLAEIQKIDREQLRLTRSLHYRHSEPNHFDRYYVHNPEENVISDKVKLELDAAPMKCDDFNDTEDFADALNNKHILETDDLHDDPTTNDLSNSDDELDVPIQSLIKAKTMKKTKAKVPKITKEKKAVASKKTAASEKVKLTKAKSNHVPKARSKAKTKLAEPKVSKTKKLKDTETERKMEEYFTVTVFKTLEEKLEEMQKRKMYSSYVNAPLKCEFCFQGYLDNETYDVHMQKHTDKYGEFLCEVCHFRCPSKSRLRHHKYYRHSRKYFCRMCRFESHDKYRATLHMRFHEGKTYKCTHCDKVFNHLVNLHNHLRAKHPSDSVCPLCGYSFLGARGLATHTALLHGHQRAQIPADGPACTECDIRFASDEALQMHLKVSSKHGKSEENLKKRDYHALHRMLRTKSPKPRRERTAKPIVRKRDGIRLEKRPIKLTTFEDPVPCEKCGVSINSPSEYHQHFMREHRHERRVWFPTDSHPHLCELCGKMLRNNALKDHMLEHTEGITFRCDTCGKRFSKRFNMRLHSRVHLGERYPCTVCGKLFNHMGNRDRHVKYVHTESKDFKCEFCGKCFKNDGARKLHTNHVHLRKPYPKRNRNREGNKKEKGAEGESTFRSECNEIWE